MSTFESQTIKVKQLVMKTVRKLFSRALSLLMLFVIPIFIISCTSREDATSRYESSVKFDKCKSVPLPSNTTYAEKRGFGDMNGDGIEDMYEISDEVFWGTDYKVNVFHGQYNQDSILNFSSNMVTYDVPVDFKWFTSATKIDVADVNGDGYYDIVFSQYIEGLRSDDMHIGYAINNKENSFYKHKSVIEVGDGLLLSNLIVSFVGGYYYDESLYDYLKMDWGDMNGDGRDDLVLMWSNNGDLDVEIFYSKKDDIGFVGYNTLYAKGFMNHRGIRQVDIENYTGSKSQDILVRYTFGSKLIVSVLETTDNGFTPHKDFSCGTLDLDLFGFEKYDSFDINNDGYADLIHLGELDDEKVCSYNIIRNEL